MATKKRCNDGNESSITKRKHLTLTILQKVKVLEGLENGLTPRDLSDAFGIGVRTVYDIRRSKEKLLKFYEKSDSDEALANRKSLHEARCSDSDDLVYKWFKERRSKGLPVTGMCLRNKAKEIHQELNREEKCDFSSGWLRRFQRRHGIQHLEGECLEKTLDEATAESDKDSAEKFIEKFSKLVADENLRPEQIYNFAETGLFWNFLPLKTLVTCSGNMPESRKEAKEKVTVLLCSNAAGTHKCKPLLVGESTHPQTVESVSSPVVYKNSKKSCMTKEIILNWFKNNFVTEARHHCEKIGLPDDCKILLLLDYHPALPDVQILDSSNIECLLLPPNTATLIQPMCQGIISSWICHYKASYLRLLLNADPSLQSLKLYQKNFSLNDAVYMIAAAWNSVSKNTLKNAWYDLWPSSVFFDSEDENEDFEGFELTEVEKEASELILYTKERNSSLADVFQPDGIVTWLSSVDDDVSNGKQAETDSQIISNRLSPSPNDSSIDSGYENFNITLNQGLELGEKYLKFLGRQSCVTQQELLTVYRLQQKLRETSTKAESREKLMVLKQPKIESVLVFTESKHNVN